MATATFTETAPTTAASTREYLGILAAVVMLSAGLQSWMPAMLIGLPTLYGSWLQVLVAKACHDGQLD